MNPAAVETLASMLEDAEVAAAHYAKMASIGPASAHIAAFWAGRADALRSAVNVVGKGVTTLTDATV